MNKKKRNSELPEKESKGAVHEDKRTGYGNKKIEGPNRPST